MKPSDFLQACIRYFGPWPTEKPGVLEAVSGYVDTKTPSFLSALWPLVRDARPQGFGPPDMACLQEHAEAAGEYMRTHTAVPSLVATRPLLEDNEPRATMAEVKAALAATAARLAEKDAETKAAMSKPEAPPKAKPFANLDDVRWDQPIDLGQRFNDDKYWADYDTNSEKRREVLEDYASRYKKPRALNAGKGE